MYFIIRLRATLIRRTNRKRAIPVLGIAFLTMTLLISGCNVHGINKTPLETKTEFSLNSSNFVMETVNATGRASCFYILFSIPLCDNQDLVTVEWEEMRVKANLDGKSAQFVNVSQDRSYNWNIFFFIYEESYSVSANTIVYR